MLKRMVSIVWVWCLVAADPAVTQNIRDDYPSDTVKIIVCVPPGGAVDFATRIIAEQLRKKFNKAVVVENRGGQAGNIGAEAVAIAAPDGYTLLASQPAPLTVNRLLYEKLNYDPSAFEPVVIMTTVPSVLLVRAGFPAKTLEEFIAYVKANPRKVNYASQGNGTTSHLTAELLQSITGTRMTHVPYRGTGPAMNDIMAGHVDMMFVEAAGARHQHESGTARILATATNKRSEFLPDIPTFAEGGIMGLESATWNAIAAPPGTSKAIVETLNRAINEIMAQPDINQQLRSHAMVPVGGTPEDMARFIRQETKRWGDVITSAKISIK